MKSIVIKLNKKKIILVLVGAVAFVLVGLILLISRDIQESYNPILVKLLAVVDIVFFGACMVYAFLKLFDNNVALLIDERGVTDNSSAVAAGLIEWKNILSISVTEVTGQKFLTIEVSNPEEIINRQVGWKKILSGLNRSLYESPVQISANILDYNFEELHRVLQENLAKYRVN